MEINTGFAEERPWISWKLDNWFFLKNRALSSNEILLRALILGKQTKVKLHFIKDRYVSGDLLIWPFLYICEYSEASRVSWNNLIITNLYHTPPSSFLIKPSWCLSPWGRKLPHLMLQAWDKGDLGESERWWGVVLVQGYRHRMQDLNWIEMRDDSSLMQLSIHLCDTFETLTNLSNTLFS